MKIKQSFFVALLSGLLFVSCDKEEPQPTPVPTPTPEEEGPKLVFKFVFDPTQARLNNLGQPSTVPAGNAAQSPVFNKMSQHYIELAGDWDLLGNGEVLYVGEEITSGGASAINHNASVMTGNNEVFFSKALSQITPGSYNWLRVSLAYQNYDITFKYDNPLATGTATGTVASFIGYRTYIQNYLINGTERVPSASTGGAGNHPQGYWGFQTTVLGQTIFFDGQAPEGATTVPNPLFASSPIPAGSCVVTGRFVNTGQEQSPLVITGNETEDIVITVSISTNNSFEWHEEIADGLYQPDAGELVVDMGVRGMIPIKN